MNKLKVKELSSKREEMQKQLEKAIRELEIVKPRLSPPVESIETDNILLGIANDCNVRIIDISSTGRDSADLQGIDCFTLLLTVKIEGDVPNLLSFVDQLTQKFPTSTIGTAKIDIPLVVPGQEPARPSLDVTLTIYTYEGKGNV